MLGEIKENNKGTKMKIIAQRSNYDIDVEFLDNYHYVFKRAKYQNFKNGAIKNPFDITVFGKGYLGDGEYSGWINGKHTEEYEIWKGIIKRCYCEKQSDVFNSYYNISEVCEFTFNADKPIDTEEFYKILGIDIANMPDAYDVQFIKLVQARKHKKRRINKKWLKRYGYKQITVESKGWKMKTDTNGNVEFIK